MILRIWIYEMGDMVFPLFSPKIKTKMEEEKDNKPKGFARLEGRWDKSRPTNPQHTRECMSQRTMFRIHIFLIHTKP